MADVYPANAMSKLLHAAGVLLTLPFSEGGTADIGFEVRGGDFGAPRLAMPLHGVKLPTVRICGVLKALFEAIAASMPGLKIAAPGSPQDLAGLLESSTRVWLHADGEAPSSPHGPTALTDRRQHIAGS